MFDGLTVEVEDTRKDYGEKRIICYGLLAGRMVVVGYTPRGPVRQVACLGAWLANSHGKSSRSGSCCG